MLLRKGRCIYLLGLEALGVERELRLLENVDVLGDSFHRVEVFLGGALILLFLQRFFK